MKQAVIKIRHMWRVYLMVFKLSIMSRFTYPMSTLFSIGSVFIDMFIYVVFANVIFSYVPHVAGFSHDQLFLIVGTSMLLEWLSWFTFRSGTSTAPDWIRNGKIEASFVKPLPSHFLALFTRMDIEDLTRAVTALLLIIPHRAAIATPVLLHVGYYIVSILCSLIIYFALLSSVSSLAFFLGKLDGLWAIVSDLNDMARYPYTIFSKKIQWIFFSIIPTAFLGSIPTLILTTQNPLNWLAFSFVIAAVSLYLSNRMWRWAESHYSGASG
ncbi:MAG: ABC-2 family transporter protein [Candidatus Magasanikbacteria bacterium]|nr:ABC-2 family transporter protein [Candidatus Magasanikbacteria bacterium]